MLIDTDVHTEYRRGFADVMPYLDSQWHEFFTRAGLASGGLPGSRSPYLLWQGAHRQDSFTASGRTGSSDYEHLRDHLIDEWGFDYVISTGSAAALALVFMPQREFAGAIAAAMNDHLIDEWLERDRRILGSLLVAAQDPAGAASEIRRSGRHPQIKQVILPMRSPDSGPWSDERYRPIWEAAIEMDLAIGLHVTGSAGAVPPPHINGWPRSYIELQAGLGIAAQSELLSLVMRGVFSEFPALRLTFIEGGFGWVPPLLWRMDKRWRELQSEVPWLTMPPSEYIRRQVRFTTQPMEEPEDPADLGVLLRQLGSDRILMFATDYPHWDFDSPRRALPANLDPALRSRIMGTNAAEFYRLEHRGG